MLAGVAVATLLWGLVGYQPVTEPAETPYDGNRPNGSYAVTMGLETNGEQFVRYDVRHDSEDGESIGTAYFDNATYTVYWDGTRSVTRSDSDTKAQYRRMLRTGDGERVVHRDNELMTAVITDANDTNGLGGQGLLLSTLEYTVYERVETTRYEGREVAVYEPQNGWYRLDSLGTSKGPRLKVENAEGVLYVDPDTRQLYYANVSYDHVNAATWGEYAITKYGKGEVGSLNVTVEYRLGRTAVEPPEWVPTESSS